MVMDPAHERERCRHARPPSAALRPVWFHERRSSSPEHGAKRRLLQGLCFTAPGRLQRFRSRSKGAPSARLALSAPPACDFGLDLLAGRGSSANCRPRGGRERQDVCPIMIQAQQFHRSFIRRQAVGDKLGDSVIERRQFFGPVSGGCGAGVMFSAWLNIGAQKRPNHGTAAVIYRAAPSVEPFAQGATSKAGRDRSFKTRPRRVG